MSDIKVKTRLVNTAPPGYPTYLEARHVPYTGAVPLDLGTLIGLGAGTRWRVAWELFLALIGAIFGPILRDPQPVAEPAPAAQPKARKPRKPRAPKVVDNPPADLA